MVRAVIALSLISGLANSVRAQDKIMPIDIKTVLKLAGSSNLDVAEINARYELAKAQQLEAKEWMIPTVSPGVLLMSYQGIAQATDGTFVDVDKNSFWAGVNVTSEWDLGNAVYSYLAAKQNVESVGYEKMVEQNRANVQAVQSFYDLSAAQSKLVALEKVALKSEDIVAQIALQVEQGITYKSDLLLAKSSLNHIKIAVSKARSAIQRNSHELLELLNISDNVQLLVSDSLLIPVNLVDTSKVEFTSAFDKRPELMVFNSRIEGFKIDRKSQTTGLLLPNVNFGLNNGPYGPYFSSEGNALNYYVGAKWEIPLGVLFYGGTKKAFDARIRIERINVDRAKNEIRREIQDEQMNLQTSKVRMKLAEASVAYASEGLDQSMERQRLGTAIPLEVIRAQEQMMEAKLDLIDAVTQYNKAQYSLYIALGNNP
jgi:outer membrane protein TolC